MESGRVCTRERRVAPARRKGAFTCVVAVLSLAWAVPIRASAQLSATAVTSLVFNGVTVVDVERGKLVPGQRVVIVGNRIQAVGGTKAIKVPKGAQLVDARGKYLIPGLWDLHSHRGFKPGSAAATVDYLLPLANGVTGIRDAYSAYVPLDSQVQWRQEILAGTRVGPPRQLLAGTPINELSEKKIADLKAKGANFLKVYPFKPGLATAARRVGLPFGGHVGGPHGKMSAIEASDSGISIIDHLNTSGGIDTLCVRSRASVERCQPVAERLRQNNTWLVPTMVILGIKGEHWGGKNSQLIIRRLNELAGQFWAGSLSHGNWLRTPDLMVDSTGIFHILHRVGMPILAGTDADGTKSDLRTFPKGFALHAELAISRIEGLTLLEALQSATLNPAKMLHATDSLGTVAAGKLADLVLLDADPLADITNTTTIRAVVANGHYFDRPALDSLLAEVIRVKAKEVLAEGEEPRR